MLPSEGAATLLPDAMIVTDDLFGSSGGELWHCHRDVITCCLGYWCPCWLFGRNLQRAGLCRYTAGGCALYTLFSGLIAFAVAGFASRNISTFMECLSSAEDNMYEPCLLAEAGLGGQPACTREDINVMLTLEQMQALGNVPQAIIASEADAVGIQCLHCVSALDRLSAQQRQHMLDRAAQSALLCDDRELSHSRLVE
eukprot:COSAG02_NODE_15479_length_1167_cov_1.161985_2_plen_197_part_01